jgi:sugar/nucleoside kinase (ribokinase family)
MSEIKLLLFKVTTILNFAPAIQIPSNEIFNYVDYLVLNEVEVAQLSQVEVNSIDDAKSASLALLNQLDVQLGVIVTLGENGVLYTDKPTKTSFHKKSSKVQVLDSTVKFQN